MPATMRHRPAEVGSISSKWPNRQPAPSTSNVLLGLLNGGCSDDQTREARYPAAGRASHAATTTAEAQAAPATAAWESRPLSSPGPAYA
jgi:hypothetical protein